MIQQTWALLALIQEQAPSNDVPPGGAGSPLAGFLPFVLIIGIFYLLVIRPESKKRREQQAMLAALGKGDQVVLSSGLYAKVIQVDDQVLTLQLADGVRVKAARWAVQHKLGADELTAPEPQA
jgi:preprotein translocase subunit YajC